MSFLVDAHLSRRGVGRHHILETWGHLMKKLYPRANADADLGSHSALVTGQFYFPEVAEIAKVTGWLPSSTYPRPECWHLVASHWLRASTARFLGEATIWSEAPSEAMLCGLGRHLHIPLCRWEAARAQSHCGRYTEETSELLLYPCSCRQASLNTALLRPDRACLCMGNKHCSLQI